LPGDIAETGAAQKETGTHENSLQSRENPEGRQGFEGYFPGMAMIFGGPSTTRRMSHLNEKMEIDSYANGIKRT
jgi:hypothetical protein